MAKCVFVGCLNKVVGGWEHHVYATAPDVTPTVIDKRRTCWCHSHESSVKLKQPGRLLTQRELED